MFSGRRHYDDQRRKRGFEFYALVILGLVILVFVLDWALRVEPKFYTAAGGTTSKERQVSIAQVDAQLEAASSTLQSGKTFDGKLTLSQLNALVAIRYPKSSLPKGISDVRFGTEDGQLLLGLKLRKGPCRALVSLRGPLAVEGEAALSLSVRKVMAGRLPVPMSLVRRRLPDAARPKLDLARLLNAPLKIESVEVTGDQLALRLRQADPDAKSASAPSR
ncbi:MAG: hypothetical protein FJ279_21400 [Planctomycetes bacterium]|nr:hypothetical protein [Planctomycetota bacterium]